MAATIAFGDWQRTIDGILTNVEPSDLFKSFSSLDSNKNRISFVFKHRLLESEDWLYRYFTSCKSWLGKSAEVAQLWRNKGNKYFTRAQYQQALDAYTQSSLAAPVDVGTTYSLSLGNRSAALFHLNKYKECLADIERAEAHKFPKKSLYKLLLRRVQALIKLGQKDDAKKYLNELQKFINREDIEFDKEKKDNSTKELEIIEKEVELLKEKLIESRPQKDPKLFKGENSVMSQATEAVSLTVTQDKGRFLLANQNVPKGSNLIVERPYAAVLLPDHYEKYCHDCFTVLPLNPIGCSCCSEVKFCNEVCRDAASIYHKTECPYSDLLRSIGVAHLSLRIVLKATVQYLKCFLKNPESHRSGDILIDGVGKSGKYERSYLSVYDLMSHEESTTSPDMLQYTLTAALLLLTLVNAGSLDDIEGIAKWKLSLVTSSKKGCDIPEQVAQIGGVLLRHILQLVCNAHAITSLQSTGSSQEEMSCSGDAPNNCVDSVQQERIATAIYPTASLMNHACQPTIQSSFIGDVLVVRNITDVKKGDEIYNCYGPHYCRMRKEERQEVLLSQYHFLCLCKACAENDVSSQRFQAFKCPKCCGIVRDAVCVECGYVLGQSTIDRYKQQATQMTAHFKAAHKLMQLGSYTDALSSLTVCLRGRETILYQDHKDLAIVEDAIAKCYSSIGDFSSSADHLLNSVVFVEKMYGDTSVEYAYELQKLSEVLFNAERFTECVHLSSKALSLFEHLYCEGHEAIRQTRDLMLSANAALMPIMQTGGSR